jgi:hypothetical protein
MREEQLWRRSDNGIEIRASITTLHAPQDSGQLYSAELRITKNDELIVREVFCDERKLHGRSMQMFEKLTASIMEGKSE